MRIERAFLRSKLARRIVALFVLSALVPIFATAILSLSQVRSLLAEQGHARLAQASEAYATSLFDRLLAADEQTMEIADRFRRDALRGSDLEQRFERKFAAIYVIDAGGRNTPFVGAPIGLPLPDDFEIQHLAQGKARIVSIAAQGGPSRIFLRRAIDASRPLDGMLVAEILPDYLWGDATALPALTDVCVTNENAKPMYCSRPGMPIAASASTSSRDALGRFTFTFAGETQLADRRELFLKPTFGVRGWTILAAKPEAEALAPIGAFNAVFLPALGLSLLVVSLLSVVQVRRTLGPLEKIIAATRRAANRDFATRVEVPTDDEFGELAQSFNTMTSRLGSQFATLTMLAEIDHAILARLDLDRIVETVVRRAHDIVAADFVSIAIRDRDAAGMMRIYTCDRAARAAIRCERRACRAEELQQLRSHTNGFRFDRQQRAPGYLDSVVRFGAQSLCALPIVCQDDVVGAIVLGFRDADAFGADANALAHDLGDRLGVAFATAAKDEQLYYQANYDALTSLPNRHFFKDQLARLVGQARRDQRQFALLFIDLDHFKNINDGLGHAAGDEVLRLAGERLRGCLRDSDIVARLGGDEFTVIAYPVKSPRDAEVLAEHIIAALREPFRVAGVDHFLGASIGIAVYPTDGADVDDLLRNADTAMYRAKDSGRDRFVYFEEEMNAATLLRMSVDRDLRGALERDEFFLVYQAQQDLRSGRISGVEALLRWRHPTLGVLLPPRFIEVAEETGLIDPIGDWVLRDACRQHRAWLADGIAMPRLAVNVSARQFRQKDFADRVDAIVRECGVDSATLELEITESLLVDAERGVEETLARLQQRGVMIALDDFGTGYSSLAYLKRFSVGTVKIDRTFIKDLPADEGSAAIVRAIIAMAHALGKRVVAEGAETAAQRAFLVGAQCDHLQGYWLSKPICANDIPAFVRRMQPHATDETAAHI